jgi:outer membrane protein assembly factor BamB
MTLAYDGTTLFGLNNGSLYTLNPTTGAYTGLGTVTGLANKDFFGMSVPVAVPEPSTYALAAIATGVMAAIARRRKARRA